MFYLCSNDKDTDQLQLIGAFVVGFLMTQLI